MQYITTSIIQKSFIFLKIITYMTTIHASLGTKHAAPYILYYLQLLHHFQRPLLQ